MTDPRLFQGLMARVQKLPRATGPAGSPGNTIPRLDSGTAPAGSYDNPRRSYQYLDDEFPNPFGGSDPYMPGAMLPGQNMMAGVLGLPPGMRVGTPRGFEQGDFSDIQQKKEEAKRQLRLDLMEPPNPFGGGSAPYMPGAMLPGAPGNLRGMYGLS